MKIERHNPSTGPRLGGTSLTATIENPAERAFSTTTLDKISEGLGRVGTDADKASVSGGDGLAHDVDGYVTQGEAKRFLADFATAPRSKQNAATLLQLFTPQTNVDVTLPKAVSPVERRHTLTFPDGAARLNELPAHLQAAAHVALDVVAHADRGDDEGIVVRTRLDPHSVVHLDDIAAALEPENIELLRNATNDVVAKPAVAATLEQLREHISTSSTTKDFVPNNPPEYVARMPLKSVGLELVTFGTRENALPVGPAGRPGTTKITPPSSFDGGRVTMTGTVSHTPGTSQQYLTEVNRYFQLQAPEGLTVVLKTETPGATIYGRAGMRTTEVVLDGNDKKHDIIDLAGIAEGAPTTLIALVFDGKKLVESAQIKLPANPIMEEVTHVGRREPAQPVPTVPTNAAPRKFHGVTVTVPGLLAALESLGRQPDAANAKVAKVLVASLKTMSPADRTAAQVTLRELARSNLGGEKAWNSARLDVMEFREVIGAAAPQPLEAALPGPFAFLGRELIGDARPVSAATMKTVVDVLKRVTVDDEAAGIRVARELLLFSPKAMSVNARQQLSDFLRFAEPQPHLHSQVAVRLGLDQYLFERPAKIVENHAPRFAPHTAKKYRDVDVTLPTRMTTLLNAGLATEPVQIAVSERFVVTAHYEAATRSFAFELQAAPGQPAVSVERREKVSLDSLVHTQKVTFGIE